MENQAEAADLLAVALDFPSARQALDCIDRLDGACRWIKVGMELFYAAGIPLVDSLLARDFKVFLDLKLHDIPNTVAAAVRSLSSIGVHLLTVHASGGEAMLQAAASTAAQNPKPPRLLAVTVLTSMDAAQMAGVGVNTQPADQVLRLARLAQSCNIDGLVCAAEELGALRKALSPSTFLAVPGIRPEGAALGDQRRTATPAEAIARGASLLVVGRPITRAANPRAAAHSILQEIGAACQSA